MDELKLYLLGSPRLEYRGATLEVGRRKALALLSYLALAEQPQSRDTLAALFWPTLDQPHARAALRTTLPTLTALVPTPWLAADRGLIALRRDRLWIDVFVFRDWLVESRSHAHSLEKVCSVCLPLLKQAVALYRDDFMAGFFLEDSAEYDTWQLTQREWLRREFAGILRRLSQFYSDQGRNDFEQALAYAQRWLALDPLHEAAHRMVMRLYAASGRRNEALRQYQVCVTTLEAELASPPEEETSRLYEAIQRGITVLAPATSATDRPGGSVLPPLPGLVVGREPALDDLKRRLGMDGTGVKRAVTVIQGWPGVGKSTLVAALAHDPAIKTPFPDGVLWTSLGETPNLASHLAVWAEALQVGGRGQSQTPEELSAHLRGALRDRRTLLIVDDIWDSSHAGLFKVGGPGCALVFTSRLNDVTHALAPTPLDIYRLPVLTDDTSLLLLGMLAPQAVAEFPEASRELVRDLEGLPLAIQVAGRLLHAEAHFGWGVDALLAELRAGARLLATQAPSDVMGMGQATPPTIAALLKRSTAALDTTAQQCFALLGLFAPKPATFDLQALAVAWDMADPRPTIRILVNRGLLEPVSGGRFQMHALLVQHARSLLEDSV